MSVKKSLAWLGSAQAISAVLQFCSSVVLARYLSPYEMGIFAIAIATTGMLSLFQQFGLNGLIVREEVLEKSVSATAFTINASLAIAFSLVIVAASFAGEVFLGEEGVGQVLRVLALPPLIGILAFLPGANLERHGGFREIALISTVTSIINAGAMIGFAVFRYSYMSVAYAQLISSTASSIMLLIVGRQHFSSTLSIAAWRRVMRFGLQSLAVSGVVNATQRFSEIMLGRILGLGALGIYNRASGLTGLFLGHIHFAVSRVVLVDFAGLHRRGESFAARYKQTVAMMTAILWPVIAGLAAIAEVFIANVYGHQWIPAVIPFLYLAAASIILTSITMTYELFIVADQLRSQTRIELQRAIISLPIFLGACTISLEAAAAARVADAVIALFLYRPHLNRITGTKFADLRGIYAQSALVTGLAVAPATVLMVAGDGAPPLAPLAGAILLGVACWGAGLFALRHPLAFELAATVRNRLPRLMPR